MVIQQSRHSLRPRQKLGKYRIERRIARGGFADVYRATDTVEGVRVALKVPRFHLLVRDGFTGFQQEVRLNARLEHPNILPIKNADFIDGVFIIAYPLGERSLDDRLRTRLSLRTAIDYSDQILAAVAHAHERRVIHCDIKPENFVLFHHDQVLRLVDFGIARFSVRTVLNGSGSGTVGYLAPEQAMGKVSFRSDVFSTGLLLYRILSGYLPEWPFEWPPAGHEVLRRKVHPEMIAFLRRAIQLDARKRFENASVMRKAFMRLKPRALAHGKRRRRRAEPAPVDWDTVRFRAFRRRFGRLLQTRHTCERCDGPIAESMNACPWCGKSRARHQGETTLPASCPRCRRGVKLDWTYCPWCYGAAVGPLSDREYSDRRYDGRCTNQRCRRRKLMPFMRYCPWCHKKVQKAWKIKGSRDTCGKCGWGVLPEFWDYCPWCKSSL